MGRVLALLYGALSYLVFLATFLYLIGFVGNLVVPKSIDSGAGDASGQALLINLLLIGIFAMQHSVMARPGFKRWWTRVVPQPIERSTYVMLSNFALMLLYWQWQPIGGTIWNLEGTMAASVIWALHAMGWLIALASTFLINHFELFGLRQVYLNLRQQEYTGLAFRTPFLYQLVRHPLMLGFLIAFWAAPHMTTGHLLFSSAMTAYILVAIQLEERDLLGYFGATYEAYRRRVSMILPFPKKQ